MAKNISLDDILGDFKPNSSSSAFEGARYPGHITIRLPPEAKTRYDRLQESSRKEFGKKVRETLLKLIELAEARAS